ncbi:hypothetical protein GCM10009613_57810 [Pseudonocardia kongjuensis]|uniref:Uncharacterized protein n=1 Tax=Pseudonocardia kongjuensis TaxID=102227 RepID=A0ABN1Y8A9_9PSEU
MLRDLPDARPGAPGPAEGNDWFPATTAAGRDRRHDAVKEASTLPVRAVKRPSRPGRGGTRSTHDPAPGAPEDPVADPEGGPVADVAWLVLTVVCFAVLALALHGLEKL